MTPDSLKRLAVTGITAALLALQPLLAKYGLHMSTGQLTAFAAIAGTFLAQSGLNAALAKASQNKAFATVAQDAGKMVQAIQAARALQQPPAAPPPAAK